MFSLCSVFVYLGWLLGLVWFGVEMLEEDDA